MSLTAVTPTALGSTGLPNIGWFNVIDPLYGAVGDGVADDTAAIQAAVDAASLSNGTVYIPYGTYMVGETVEVLMASNVKILGEMGAQLKLAERIAGYHGCITVPEGVDNWWIEGLDFMGLYPGTGTRTDPSNGGIWIWGSSNGMVRDCTAHHFDYSGFNIFTGKQGATTDATDITFENCVAYSNGVDGFEINTADEVGLPTATVAERIRFINCRAYSNEYAGLELTGGQTPSGETIRDIDILGFRAYSNRTDGVYIVPITGNPAVRVTLADVHSYSNTSNGINLGPDVSFANLSDIHCWSNGTTGLEIQGQDIDAAGLHLHGNTQRAIRMTAAVRRINIAGVYARSNGSGASSGQASIDVGVGGTGAEDVNITGLLCSGAGKEGVQFTSTKRGYVEGTIIGSGATGLGLVGADRLHGQVSCINNSSTGMQGSSTPTRCALDLYLSDDTGGSTQTTGWSLANGTNNHIREIYNDCSTPRSDSGTGTVNTTH